MSDESHQSSQGMPRGQSKYSWYIPSSRSWFLGPLENTKCQTRLVVTDRDGENWDDMVISCHFYSSALLRQSVLMGLGHVERAWSVHRPAHLGLAHGLRQCPPLRERLRGSREG